MPEVQSAVVTAAQSCPLHLRKEALDDEALMARVQRGDTEAFGRLYDRHARLTLGLARRICGPDLAEDAVQGAFLSAWNGRATFSSEHGNFRAWICRISRNRALDLLRADRSRRADMPDSSDALDRHVGHDPLQAEAPPQLVERAETESELWEALQQLPDAQREVIVLAYFGGMSHSEIAKALGAPYGTIKGRMRLGLTRLRRDPRVGVRSRGTSREFARLSGGEVASDTTRGGETPDEGTISPTRRSSRKM